MSDSKSTTGSDSSFLVVNMRGLVNTRAPVRTTLEQLSLIRRFNATIVPNNEVYRGMLNLAKDHVAWCKVDKETVEALLKARAEVSDGKRFEELNLSRKAEFSSYSELAEAIASGRVRLDGTQGMRRFFRLNSPRGGFKRSIRRQYGEGGILGPNVELAKFVRERMI